MKTNRPPLHPVTHTPQSVCHSLLLCSLCAFFFFVNPALPHALRPPRQQRQHQILAEILGTLCVRAISAPNTRHTVKCHGGTIAPVRTLLLFYQVQSHQPPENFGEHASVFHQNRFRCVSQQARRSNSSSHCENHPTLVVQHPSTIRTSYLRRRIRLHHADQGLHVHRRSNTSRP